MKSKLVVMMLLAGSSLFGENHFSIGIGIGVPGYWSPPPPPVVYYAPPPCPDPAYTWIEGYWYPVGPRYHWHETVTLFDVRCEVVHTGRHEYSRIVVNI